MDGHHQLHGDWCHSVDRHLGRRGTVVGSLMPKDPKGRKRPADVIGNAVRVMKIAIGEVAEPPDARNQAAVARGRIGGPLRAKALSPLRRREIASQAARARWKKAR
jgi:hypothetical protein